MQFLLKKTKQNKKKPIHLPQIAPPPNDSAWGKFPQTGHSAQGNKFLPSRSAIWEFKAPQGTLANLGGGGDEGIRVKKGDCTRKKDMQGEHTDQENETKNATWLFFSIATEI